MIQEAIACRQRAGEGPRQARALTELVPLPRVPGAPPEAENAVAEATRLVAADWKGGSSPACTRRAPGLPGHGPRGDRRVPGLARTGDPRWPSAAATTRPRSMRASRSGTAELGRDVAAGRATLETRSCSAGARPTRSRSRGRSTTSVRFAASRHDHELANTYLGRSARPLPRARPGPVANQRPRSCSDGRCWTRAAGPRRRESRRSCSRIRATRRGRTTRRCSYSRSCAPARETRARGRRSTSARAVGVPAEESARSSTSPPRAPKSPGSRAGRATSRRRPTDSSPRPLVRGADKRSAGCRSGELWAGLRGHGARRTVGPLRARPRGRLESGGSRDWQELGCPYEHSLALVALDDEDALRRSLAGAAAARRPARSRRWSRAACGSGEHATCRAARGYRHVSNPARPHGPRTRRASPSRRRASRNAEIAERLFPLPRTVDHHVSAILRNSASACAARLSGRGAPRAARRPVARLAKLGNLHRFGRARLSYVSLRD